MRPKVYIAPLLKKAVLDEFRRDPRPCAVANKFGLHHQRVKKWLEEAGLWKHVPQPRREPIAPISRDCIGLAIGMAHLLREREAKGPGDPSQCDEENPSAAV